MNEYNTPSKKVELKPLHKQNVKGYIVAYFFGNKPTRTYSYNSKEDRKQVIAIMVKWPELKYYDIKPQDDILNDLFADTVTKELLLEALNKAG